MNIRKLLVPGIGALAVIAGVAGGSLANTLNANAATASTTAANNVQQPPAPQDPSKGGHVGANGVKEVLLTGDAAAKAKTAALAAVPGGTILRVETDAEGATYEAHMTKSDGTPVTIKMDGSFKVTGTEAGPGAPPDMQLHSN